MWGLHGNPWVDWPAAVAAVVTATGVVFVKVVRPVWRFATRIDAWMDDVHTAVEWVHRQMKPNNGSSLVDKVDWLVSKEKAREASTSQHSEG